MAANDIYNGQFAQRISIEEYEQQKRECTQKALEELNKQLKEHVVPRKYSNLNDEDDEDGDVIITDISNELDVSNDMDYFISDDNDNDNDEIQTPKTRSRTSTTRGTSTNKGVNVIINTSTAAEAPNARANARPVSSGNDGIRRRKTATPTGNANANGNATVNGRDAKSLEFAEIIYAKRESDLLDINRLKQRVRRLESHLEEEERKNHFLKLDLNNATIDNSNLQKKVVKYEAQIKQQEENITKYNNFIILQKIIIVLFILHYICFVLF